MSQAIRRVGADVGGLSRGTQLANQRAQLQIAGNRLRASKQIAADELASINTGSRSIAMQQRRAALTKSELSNAQALRRNYEQQLGTKSAIERKEIQLSQLSRRINSSSLAKGEFGGMNQAELEKAYTAAQRDHVRLLSSAQTLQKQEELLTTTMSDQSLAARKVAADETELFQRQAQLTAQINTNSRAIELNTEKLDQNARATQLNKYENFANTAGKVEHAGRAVQMFGVITAAAMGYAADKAAQFNTQVTIAASKVKQPGMGVQQIMRNAQLIQQQLLNQLASGQSVASPTDLTQATYRTLSGLQLPGNTRDQIKESIKLVKQFGDVVKANFGMTDIAQVTNGAILAMRDFKVGIKDVPGLLNTMQAAEKYGRMTMGEFIATFNQAAPAARAANYSFKEMAGTIAFLSTKMTTAPAATGYARLLQTLAQNADKFNKAGYQVTDRSGKNLLPLEQIIKNITDKNPELAKGGVLLQNFFKQVTGQTGYLQARKVFVFLAQDQAGLSKITKQVTNDQKVLANTIKASGLSPGVQWAEFKNQLQGIFLVLGAGAIPAFKAFAAPLVAVIKWFEQLNPDTQKFIGYGLALVGILATLGGTLAAVGGGLARMGSILAASIGSKGLGGLASETGAVQLRMAAMLGTVGLLLLLFTAFHKQTMDVVNALGGVGGVVEMALGAAAGIAVLRLVGYMSSLAKTINTVRDAEIAASAVNPFMLMAAALGVLVVIFATRTDQIKRGFEIMLNTIYNFFINSFVNPQIRALDVLINAYNKFFGWATGNISRIGEIAAKSIFDVTGYRKLLNERINSDTRFANLFNNAISSGINPVTLFNKQMKMNVLPDFGTFWLSHIQYTFKEAQKAYDKLKKSMADNLLQSVLKGPPKPLVPPAGSSPAIMERYKEQLSLYNKLHKAASDNVAANDRMAKAAKQYGTTVTKSFTQTYDAYKKLLAIAKADPGNYQKQLAAENALMALQQVASKQQLAAAEKSANAMTSSAATTKTTFQDVLNSIQGMYNNFLQNEQTAFGTLFQGPFENSPVMQNYTQWGGKPTGGQLTKDLKSQISQFKTFHNDLDKLARRGAPAQLIQQLMDLGPSALPQIKALMSLSTSGLNNYFSMFQKAQNLIQQQTMKDLNRQLNEYRKFGQNIALAIVAGLQDQNVAVTNALKKMIHSMFPGLKGAASFAKPVSHTTVRTGHVHTQPHHNPHLGHSQGTHSHRGHYAGRNPMTSNTGGEVHYNYYVTAPKDANLDTQIRHAVFHTRNRHK